MSKSTFCPQIKLMEQILCSASWLDD